MNVFKEKPIKIIYSSSLFLCLYIIFMNIMKKIDMTYYILSSTITSLIFIYAIYVKANFDYEKVNTKFKLFKFRFDIVNGYLINKFIIYIITCLGFILYNVNPFQKERFDFLSIVFISVMAICLLMFVKITPTNPSRNNYNG